MNLFRTSRNSFRVRSLFHQNLNPFPGFPKKTISCKYANTTLIWNKRMATNKWMNEWMTNQGKNMIITQIVLGRSRLSINLSWDFNIRLYVYKIREAAKNKCIFIARTAKGWDRAKKMLGVSFNWEKKSRKLFIFNAAHFPKRKM